MILARMIPVPAARWKVIRAQGKSRLLLRFGVLFFFITSVLSLIPLALEWRQPLFGPGAEGTFVRGWLVIAAILIVAGTTFGVLLGLGLWRHNERRFESRP